MENITSLNSPHIERVKALTGPRGKKNRETESAFIAEGIQTVREALTSKLIEGLAVKQVYVTESGLAKLQQEIPSANLEKYELIKVSDQVMTAMADSESPQGIIALCSSKSLKLSDLWASKPSKIAFFWQIQDPGNAGTVIRSADACGFDAVVFSSDSVDIFNPKTVRATVGSLWHIPVVTDVNIDEFINQAGENDLPLYALAGEGEEQFNSSFITRVSKQPSGWLFGNEARGLPTLPPELIKVSDQVMTAMADSESPQGIIALCSSKSMKLSDLWASKPSKIAFFWQIQDPGNAGTVIRTADACGFDAVVFSSDSVDIFNPKTVRASVGSLWHIPVVTDVNIDEFINQAGENDLPLYALAGEAEEQFNSSFISRVSKRQSGWLFGNEARGLPTLPSELIKVAIPMKGFAESLNVASAAAIVLHSVGLSL